MSLVPFHLTLDAAPVAIAEIERTLSAWARRTHGPDGRVVRWAIVAGPDHGADGPWQIEGVAGPLPSADPGVG